MAEDWIPVRLPRRLHARLRDLAGSLDRARVAGHPCLQGLEPPLAIHTVIERVLSHFERHAQRRTAYYKRKQARGRARFHVHEGRHIRG